MSVDTLDRLHGFARAMRNDATEPERRLWAALRAGQLDGFKFRRQAVIADAIVDFLCPRRGLVVEIDGHTHVDPRADAQRDARLAVLGFHVLRVTNTDVMNQCDGVLERVRDMLRALPDRRHLPHPNPSPEGEGLRG